MALDVSDLREAAGLVPKICDAPLRYDRWMFSLLGEGDLCLDCAAKAGAKKGEVLERLALKAGESSGGVFETSAETAGRIQGPEERLEDTAERTGDVAWVGDWVLRSRSSSCCLPLA